MSRALSCDPHQRKHIDSHALYASECAAILPEPPGRSSAGIDRVIDPVRSRFAGGKPAQRRDLHCFRSKRIDIEGDAAAPT